MVGSRQLERIVSAAAEHGTKVVLIGDAEQLQPIEAGAAFRAIAERVGYQELSGIRRQREA
jgi:ATP-dependent exoDNAse (exonuclease V) alpha subunit